MDYNTYEVYSYNDDGDGGYGDLQMAILGGLECGDSLDTTIYVFSCADGWQTLPDGSREWGTPAGFEPTLLRTLTIAEAIRETGYQEET